MFNILAQLWRFNGTHLINLKYQNIPSLLNGKWTNSPNAGTEGTLGTDGSDGK